MSFDHEITSVLAACAGLETGFFVETDNPLAFVLTDRSETTNYGWLPWSRRAEAAPVSKLPEAIAVILQAHIAAWRQVIWLPFDRRQELLDMPEPQVRLNEPGSL